MKSSSRLEVLHLEEFYQLQEKFYVYERNYYLNPGDLIIPLSMKEINFTSLVIYRVLFKKDIFEIILRQSELKKFKQLTKK